MPKLAMRVDNSVMNGQLLEETKCHRASERPGKSLRTVSTRTNTTSGTE